MVRKTNRQISRTSVWHILPQSMFLMVFLFACSQSSIEKEFSRYTAPSESGTLLRKVAREDYKVIKSSSKMKTDWISHPQKYGVKELKNKKEQLFFSFMTGPKTSLDIACTMARAFTRQDMADFLVKFYREGEESREWDSFLVTEGHEYFKNFFKQATLEKTYWEHREYRSELNFQGRKDAYICALLIRVNEKALRKVIKKFQTKVIKEFSYRAPLDIKAVEKTLDPDNFILFYKMNY